FSSAGPIRFRRNRIHLRTPYDRDAATPSATTSISLDNISIYIHRIFGKVNIEQLSKNCRDPSKPRLHGNRDLVETDSSARIEEKLLMESLPIVHKKRGYSYSAREKDIAAETDFLSGKKRLSEVIPPSPSSLSPSNKIKPLGFKNFAHLQDQNPKSNSSILYESNVDQIKKILVKPPVSKRFKYEQLNQVKIDFVRNPIKIDPKILYDIDNYNLSLTNNGAMSSSSTIGNNVSSSSGRTIISSSPVQKPDPTNYLQYDFSIITKQKEEKEELDSSNMIITNDNINNDNVNNVGVNNVKSGILSTNNSLASKNNDDKPIDDNLIIKDVNSIPLVSSVTNNPFSVPSFDLNNANNTILQTEEAKVSAPTANITTTSTRDTASNIVTDDKSAKPISTTPSSAALVSITKFIVPKEAVKSSPVNNVFGSKFSSPKLNEDQTSIDLNTNSLFNTKPNLTSPAFIINPLVKPADLVDYNEKETTNKNKKEDSQIENNKETMQTPLTKPLSSTSFITQQSSSPTSLDISSHSDSMDIDVGSSASLTYVSCIRTNRKTDLVSSHNESNMIQPVDIGGGGANNGGSSFKFDLEVPKTQPIQLYSPDTSSTFIFNNPFSLQHQQQQQNSFGGGQSSSNINNNIFQSPINNFSNNDSQMPFFNFVDSGDVSGNSLVLNTQPVSGRPIAKPVSKRLPGE
ncbi:10851_t:CDS:2, partial [Entrophospora sp. SA101]